MPTRGMNFLRDLGRLHELECPHWNVKTEMTGSGDDVRITHQCVICHKWWSDEEYTAHQEKKAADQAAWEKEHPIYRIPI